MIEIRLIKLADVSEDLAELTKLQNDGWKLRDRTARNGELVVLATRETKLCRVFTV